MIRSNCGEINLSGVYSVFIAVYFIYSDNKEKKTFHCFRYTTM